MRRQNTVPNDLSTALSIVSTGHVGLTSLVHLGNDEHVRVGQAGAAGADRAKLEVARAEEVAEVEFDAVS